MDPYLKTVEEVDEKSIIGDYEILDTLGHGTYGTVYQARHRPTTLLVALKTILKETVAEQNQIDNIFAEIKISKSLHHPFIAEVFDFFQSPKHYYIVMEYSPNGDLSSLIKKNNCIPEERAKQIFLQLIAALFYLYQEKHVAHRDIKAENIIFYRYDNIRLIDFGFSKVFTLNNQMFQTKCGTPFYLPPEVINGMFYDSRCDIWSAGMLLYHMVSGKYPFGENEKTLDHRILNRDVTFPQSFSSNLLNLLMKMLSKDHKNRIRLSEMKSHPCFSDFEYNL
jgi:serine/threonine protein kinase